MNYYAIIPTIASLIIFFNMTFVLALNAKGKINRAYGLLACFIFLWVFGSIFYYIPLHENHIIAGLKINSIFWNLIGFSMVNFTYVYIGRKRDILYYIFLGHSIVIIILSLGTDLVIGGYYRYDWGIWNIGGPFFKYAVLSNLIIPILISSILIYREKNNETPMIKKQQFVIIIGVLLTVIVGSILEFLLPKTSIFQDAIRFSPSSTVLLSFFIFYAIVKYQIFTPSIQNVSNNIFANLQDGVIILKTDGKVIQANKAAEEILEIKTDEMDNINLSNLIRNYKSNSNYKNHETRTLNTKKLKTVLLTQSSISINNYHIGDILIIKDITKRKMMIRDLKQSEEQLRILVEDITDAIYTLTEGGIITYVSPVIQQITGFNPDEMVGKEFTEFINEKDWDKAWSVFNKTMEGEKKQLELLLKTKEGKIKQVITTLKPIIFNNEAFGVRGVITNIDELQKAKKALEETEKRYILIANNVNDLIWTFDFNKLSVTYASPSVKNILGYEIDEYMAKDLDERIEDVSLQNALAILQDELEHDNERPPERWRRIELREIRKDGTFVDTEATISFLRDQDGKPLELIGVSRDITERKKLEEQLNNSLDELKTRNDLMEKDLETAQMIQKALLPSKVPEVDNIDIAFRHLPLEAVGGDYFNFVSLQEGGLSVFLGDVAGHGVPAALFLSLVKSTTNTIWRAHALSPESFITVLNKELFESMQSYFITAIYGVFHTAENETDLRFTFSNGGHPYPILIKKDQKHSEYLYAKGPMVGAFEDVKFFEETIKLEKGDRLFIYTDGLPETMNEKKKYIGYETLIDLISKANRADLEETLDVIMEGINRFRGRTPIADDIVIIGFEVT